MNSQASEGQARKAAAQAVIELTDRLAAAEEEAAALRRHLKHTRSLTKVLNIEAHFAPQVSSSNHVRPDLWQKHAITSKHGELRSVLQVGQELEDVLTERDALKAVNKELAKRVTPPGTQNQQVGELHHDLSWPFDVT